MGQYFNAYVEGKDETKVIRWYQFCSGAKLMEQAHIGSMMCGVVEGHIVNSPKKVAWIGDYATPEYMLEEGRLVDGYKDIFERVWGGEDEAFRCVPLSDNVDGYIRYYLINHTKKVYLSLKEYMNANAEVHFYGGDYGEDPIHSIYCIDPLPLLTACGSSLGSGDYYGENMDAVGSWAFDEISISREKPNNYAKVMFKFKEK